MKFDFTEEEKIEIGEAMAETDAIKRMMEECASTDRPDTCGPKTTEGLVTASLLLAPLIWGHFGGW